MPLFRAVCLLFTLLWCAAAHASGVKLVTGSGYAPYASQDLPEGGMISLLVRKAFEARGIPSSLQWRPWNRGYLRTRQGDFDATFPYIQSEKRQRHFIYSDPLYTGEQYIFSRVGEPVESVTAAALKGKRLCYPLGWQAPDSIEDLVSEGKLKRHSPPGLYECAQLLLLGRDDFFLAEKQMAELLLERLGPTAKKFTYSRQPINRNTLHLIIPRNRPNAQWLMDEFNMGLALLHESGEYQRLVDDYLRQMGEINQTSP